jgi:arylsulfatase A-like enzyme
MPYDILHAERKEWLAAKDAIIEGIQSGDAAALEELREGYARSVERSSETFFATFLGELESLGLREETVLAFVSDHGESWGERFADKEAVKGTYHMHGATVYDEIVEVPLIVSAPGRVEPGVVSSQVSLVDLAPTLLELAGAPLEGVDGVSLVSALDGAETDDRDAWIVATDAGRVSQLALRRPPWKLTVHVESGEEEAYALDRDPRERVSVPDEVPGELREQVYAELEGLEQPELTAEDEAAVTARLTDLGYL